MAIGLFDAGASSLDLRREIELDVVGAETNVPELADEAPADLVLPNHKDLAYTKIRFDERSLATITDRLSDLADPLARTLCWNAVWEMVRDADLPARRYVDIVLNNVDGETDIGVVGDLIGRMAHGRSTCTATRRTAMRSGRRLPLRREAFLEGAEPGSDFQLAWARAFIGSANSDARHRLREGTPRRIGDRPRPGDRHRPALDDRRVSLAKSGNADDSLIAAELERDPTDDGERHAAAARASRPTAEAKAETWERVMNDTELSLAMLRALAGGFNRTDQEELLRPYADRYFDELLPFWERRELDLGLAFTGGFYPKLYTQDVLDRTDALLAGEPPRPVRRILTEQRFESARTMRARVADRYSSGLSSRDTPAA